MTEDMGKDMKSIVMEIYMRESLQEVRQMEWVFINGKMERFIRVIGSMVRRTG
jgi:hypothetical protein